MWQTKVEDVCRTSPMRSLVIHQNTPLDVAIERFAADDELHGIFLIDDHGRLVGVINNHSLLQWARLRFRLPSGALGLSLSQVRRLVLADIMQDLVMAGSEEAVVRLNDTVGEAIAKMSLYNLLDIPVVDDQGRIVNDLRLSEILSFAVHAPAAVEKAE